MLIFKKQFISALAAIFVSFFAVGTASAQTWNALSMNGTNPCMVSGTTDVNGQVAPGQSGSCQCAQGYTYGQADNANCTMSGFIPGCWNPNNGTCNTCGSGGTIILGGTACFNSGQGNAGSWTGANGISCTGSVPSTWGGQSTQCVGSNNTSGGYSTN
jgi:hypothetical protein